MNNLERFRLARIILENPDLPVLCMVDGDLVADVSCRRWAASIGSVEVKEYVRLNPDEEIYTDGQVIFWKEDADELARIMCECVPDNQKDEYQAAVEKVAQMDWTKAIVVNIDLPEE